MEFTDYSTDALVQALPGIVAAFSKNGGAKAVGDAEALERLLRTKYSEAVALELRSFETSAVEYRRSFSRLPTGQAYLMPLLAVREVLVRNQDEIAAAWNARIEERKAAKLEPAVYSRKVFLVHGHDDAMRESVANFLRQLEFQPVILRNEPNRGRTLIEKFEHYSDVGFAVVLLSPDDEVVQSTKAKTVTERRARQNVVFELGFFYGKLGRHRVCALRADGVEEPSDMDGVVYVPYDQGGGWTNQLIRELKAAEYEVDANKAFT